MKQIITNYLLILFMIFGFGNLNAQINGGSITPTANGDAAEVCAGKSVTISVLGNDSNPQNYPLTITSHTNPSSGTLVKNSNNTFTFTADANSPSQLTFNYTVKSDDGVIPFTDNNHYYEWVPDAGVSWTDAKAAADLKTFNGMQGYLVTVTSQAEMNFVNQKLQGQGWMGATDIANEGVWRWVTGPEGLEDNGQGRHFTNQNKVSGYYQYSYWYGYHWVSSNCRANTGSPVNGSYTSWYPREPNNCGAYINQYSATDPNRGGEHYGHFYQNGTWNDYANSVGSTITGYVVEYGGLEPSIPQLTATATVTITINPTPAFSNNLTDVSCPGGSDGSIDINMTSGTAPYNFSWSNGSSTEDISGLTTGNYNLNLTDSKGCTNSASFTINQNDNTNPVAVCKNVTVSLDANGNASIVNPATTTNLLFEDWSNDASGYYSNQSLTNWTVNGDIDLDDYVPGISGKEIDLSGFSNSSITSNQTFTLSPGDYTFSFQHRTNTTSGNTVNVVIGSLVNSTFTTTSSVQTETINFTVTSTETANIQMIQGGTDDAYGSFIGQISFDQNLASSLMINDGSYDNCGISNISASQTNFTCSDIGNNNITLTVIDNSGNTSTCTAVVTVEDNIMPTISCQQDISAIATSANGATVNFNNPTASDNCSYTINQTSGLASGSQFPVGTTTNTFEVTDAGGNTVSCSFDVIVTGTAPQINCPSDITLNNGTNQCGAVANFSATETTAVPASTITYSHTSGTIFPVGTTTVTVIATNAIGADTCTFDITVIDVVNPTISCPFDITVNNDPGQCGAVVNYNTPSATDNCGTGTLPTSIPGYTYKGIHNGHAYFLSNSTSTPEAAHSAAVALGGHLATISDAAENSFISGLSSGLIWIGHTDRDVEGQWEWISSEAVNYTNWSYGEPNNAGNEDWAVINWSAGGQWNDWTYTSSALYVVEFDGGSITPTLTSGLASGSTFPVGVNTVTYTATDASGNSTTCSFTVTVNDTEAPVINCPVDITDFATSANGAVVNYNMPTVTENCTYTINQTAGLASGSTFPIGTTTNTFVVTDASGNTTSCSFDVSIEGLAPQINCPADIVVSNDAGQCDAIVNYSATETTGIPASTISYSIAPGSSFSVGTTTVTATATNAVGTSSCTFNVTVEDNEAPNVITQDVSIYLDGAGSASVTANDINSGSTDNCGIDNISIDNNTFSCSNLGINTVTLTVTDIHGNSNSATAVVNVIDSISPVANAQNIDVYLDANGQASINAQDIDNGSNDNCTISNTSIDVTDFDCSNVGTNQVILTVEDASGGVSASYTQHITNAYGGQRNKVLLADFDGDNNLDMLIPNWLYSNANGSGTSFTSTSLTQYQHGHGGAYGDVDNDGDLDIYTEGKFIRNNGNGSFQYTQQLNSYGVFGKSVIADFNGDGYKDIFDPTYYGSPDPVYLYNSTSGQFDLDSNYTSGSYQICGAAGDFDGDGDNDIIAAGYYNVWLMINDGSGKFNRTSIHSNGNNYYRTVEAADFDGDGDLDLAFANITNGVEVWTNNGSASFTISNLTDPVSGACFWLALGDIDNDGDLDIVENNYNNNASIWTNNGGSFSYKSSNVFNNYAVHTIAVGDLNGDGFTDIVGSRNGNAAVYLSDGTSNNFSTDTAIVTVHDTISPVVFTNNITVQLDAYGQASISTNDIDNGSYDNCGINNVSLDKTNFSCADVGPNQVILSVEDIHGNINTETATVTVIDDIIPTVYTNDQTIYLDANGNASITVASTDNNSTDNCSIATLSLDNMSFDCSDVGTNTVTLTAVDVNGNSSSATATITVVDNINPTVSANDQTIYLDANGNASITVASTDNNSFDNCGIDNLSLDNMNFDCSNVGANTVILTAVDVNGNSSSATATITVIDDIAPDAVCKTATVTLSNGAVSITPQDVDGGSFDNCGIETLEVSPNSFDCYDIGTNNVTLTVTDVNGNVSSCQTTVEVIGEIPVCSIDLTMSNNTYTGGNGSTIYLGYGPQSLTASVTASGGGPFTYSWSGGNGYLSSTTSANPVFTPTAEGNYNLSCTVTNSYGCETTCYVSICVLDIRANNKTGKKAKVYICHVPRGNPNNAKTLKVSVNAVPAHLSNHGGDKLGRCDQTCNNISAAPPTTTTGIYENNHEPELSVYPNPTHNSFNLVLDSHSDETITLIVTDAVGRVIMTKDDVKSNDNVEFGNDLNDGVYYVKVIQGDYVKAVKIIKM